MQGFTSSDALSFPRVASSLVPSSKARSPVRSFLLSEAIAQLLGVVDVWNKRFWRQGKK